MVTPKDLNGRCVRGFTLIELLVVIGVIVLLVGLGLPVMNAARQYAAEGACRSNLRQMTVILKTYCIDNDNRFPDPSHLYHSRLSLDPNEPVTYGMGCRWHDARIGPASVLMREHKELQGALIPYLGNPKILLCKTGARANKERGCTNTTPIVTYYREETHGDHHGMTAFAIGRGHDANVPIVPQYTYAMNGNLCRAFRTGGPPAGLPEYELNAQTLREWQVRKESQVTRSPSEVFAFGEENSWTINAGESGTCNLSGRWAGHTYRRPDTTDYFTASEEFTGKLTLGGLDIETSYVLTQKVDRYYALKVADTAAGDAFATCHRPRGGDLNTGFSHVSMLDGHVRKVTVSDQLRKSRRVEGLPDSALGPGGNLQLAWPLDVPPLAGWENQ